MSVVWYTKTHLWIRAAGGEMVVGMTDFAQEQMSDVTFVELPEVGDHILAEDEVMRIESIVSESDIYTPLTGTITAVNEKLLDQPDLINRDPMGEGWLFRLRPDGANDMGLFMDADTYDAMLSGDPE